MDESAISAHLDADAFRRLTAAFYRGVRQDILLAPLYPPDDWEGAEQRLAGFLCFRFLGIRDYIDQRGHPALRARHMPFAIGSPQRDRWLDLMGAAMKECDVPAEAGIPLAAFFAQVADAMRNQPG